MRRGEHLATPLRQPKLRSIPTSGNEHGTGEGRRKVGVMMARRWSSQESGGSGSRTRVGTEQPAAPATIHAAAWLPTCFAQAEPAVRHQRRETWNKGHCQTTAAVVNQAATAKASSPSTSSSARLKASEGRRRENWRSRSGCSNGSETHRTGCSSPIARPKAETNPRGRWTRDDLRRGS